MLRRWKPTVTLTSELWGKQQGLEQRVKVAGASLVFDAAQIASPTRRGRLARALRASAPRGRRGETFVLLLLEKIPEHADSIWFRFSWNAVLIPCQFLWYHCNASPLAISSWSCRVLCWQPPGSLGNKKTWRGWTLRIFPDKCAFDRRRLNFAPWEVTRPI